MNSAVEYLPGALVRARGREWVIEPGSEPDCLHLRPLGGSDEDVVTLIPSLEPTPPEPATFPWPNPQQLGTHDAARLLHDAVRLKLRAGAGPFRSFGNIALEPRAYQLVPLLMALKLPIVRLLIADDVGVGKTIEAGLIIRELFDRGEIARFAVLCPPHLVEQWQQELAERFHLRAVALTSATASRLERELPHGASLFDVHPFIVVSLDYIKSERHREHFLTIAPECVVVDEAHTCAASGQGRQLRFELLQRLSAEEARHLILLTATPHSGDEAAFFNLLRLLRPEFAKLQGVASPDHPLRQELARHFVQRRRKDIEAWQHNGEARRIFPRRMTGELTYRLTGRWGAFFDAVQNYCIELAARIEGQETGAARLIWYATLALLRCVGSSPAAAERALTTRLTGMPDELEALTEEEALLDGDPDTLASTDLEPAARLEDNERLTALISEARALAGDSSDPKLAALIGHLRALLDDGFRPVVFCRYVATAHYVANHLREQLSDATVDAVTGEYTPEEREQRVAALAASSNSRLVLVATDCLSEGINLQHTFTAVVHYDLAWNPTRHEQREGRIDRFGQKAPEVRCTMLYGEDNPVDGFVLNVILRKAEAIRRELGVLVPIPEDKGRINQAIVKAALLKRRRIERETQQSLFDFGEETAAPSPLTLSWQDALEKARANRTVFAQRRLRPEEVLPEWERQRAALGNADDVQRFVTSACARLNAPLEPRTRGGWRLLPQHLPQTLRERLNELGIGRPLAIDFHYPPSEGACFIHRSHPLVACLAEHVLESALTQNTPMAARAAVTVTAEVDRVTTLYLLRVRHHLEVTRRGRSQHLMAEEAVTFGVRGRTQPQWLLGDQATPLLAVRPTANLDSAAATYQVQQALDFLQAQREMLERVANDRAAALLADHRRVREAARDIGQYVVRPHLPVDVLGVYVLLPEAV
ncbi:MAG: DEAD/DEAH box helicase [Casimicrobiaceae bacterium]|nr:DEAD/DEAH box helicase [Casimicrobiaceae bacterium]